MQAASILLVISYLSSCLAVGSAPAVLASAEHARDVAALQPLRELVRASNVSLAGWASSSSSEPCGAANCSSQQGLGVPQCAWEGVGCQNGRVTTLRLMCGEHHPCVSRIHGRLPASLGSLSALQVLCLRDNALTGSLPSGEGWSSLVQLDLHGNSLTSTLPPQWGAWLTQLTDLDLSDNQLTGYLPWVWGDFKSISQIDLSSNRLSGGIPLSWSSLSSLKVLLLSGNCAMCGGIPMLHAKLSARNTSLGAACTPGGGCNASSYSNLMIALSILLGSFALCLLQRHICWRCRVAGLLAQAQRLEALEALEAGRASGPKRRALRRIPSFEAFVELREELPGGKSSHGKAAAEAAEGTQQQQQQQQLEVLGASPLGPAAATSSQSFADRSWPNQQQQQAGDPSSVHRHDSPAIDQLRDLQPPFSVIVMPDGQHLALAVPEIAAAQDTAPAAVAAAATAQSSEGSTRQGSAASNTPQQQQQQQQWRQRMRGALHRSGQALLHAVVYLFVQPVPRASDFEQAYAAGHERGSNSATIL